MYYYCQSRVFDKREKLIVRYSGRVDGLLRWVKFLKFVQKYPINGERVKSISMGSSSCTHHHRLPPLQAQPQEVARGTSQARLQLFILLYASQGGHFVSLGGGGAVDGPSCTCSISRIFLFSSTTFTSVCIYLGDHKRLYNVIL